MSEQNLEEIKKLDNLSEEEWKKANLWEIGYDELIEKIKKEFDAFLNMAKEGKYVKYQGLKARKKTMELRRLLVEFREASLEHERKLTELKSTDPQLLKALQLRGKIMSYQR